MALTKVDLVEKMITELNITRSEAFKFVDLIFETIKEKLEEGTHVKISGFGNWLVKSKHARMGRNPQTGTSMEISARKVVTFKPSQVLRDLINESTPSETSTPKVTSSNPSDDPIKF